VIVFEARTKQVENVSFLIVRAEEEWLPENRGEARNFEGLQNPSRGSGSERPEREDLIEKAHPEDRHGVKACLQHHKCNHANVAITLSVRLPMAERLKRRKASPDCLKQSRTVESEATRGGLQFRRKRRKWKPRWYRKERWAVIGRRREVKPSEGSIEL
jgi:hypothetical protein